ncbi:MULTISPECIES: RsmB/NOP family class I SAM-dependent RNA methyltransferase [Sphingobium]|uniref:RsmB/NOP family class I SAM-dependent RNA methyltransferase n=1 Tax=Sphingobium TaxID=165695 RepID=UPI0015EBC2C6|nr:MULTISPECIES: RsmB/NOP family class I SAM-dependent RNA methyltransferase [Sphingobium]MCW2361586.1 16S rRNA (cytosine967-C5)-methyltransferase [Sphingobium sp. B10D3B]MCW2401735.1 16S rRNA (cytosine967-C5)-methyltransferase [Sphingobium sp. B10D7B]MCW2408714.1 16S rRNA (cytosine967-C5)-methyltransferase [Sphingobium xanthum]
MTPAARVQAAIDLLDLIIASARDDGAAADTQIARYFRERRYAGSKDRRAVRDLVYRAVRAYGDPPLSGRAAMVGLARADAALAALFDGSAHAPTPLGEAERGPDGSRLPGWTAEAFAELVDEAEQEALLDRAPLHVRRNPLRASDADILARWSDARPIEATTYGYALPAGTDVPDDGMAEVQDAGSQLIAQACHATPGLTVLDLCAGAGGKTLALAADMVKDGALAGRLVAADAVRDRLARLTPRAERAGYGGQIEPLLLDSGREEAALKPLVGQCDLILIDAPCSGSGTWRRNPEARWRLTPARLDRVVALQARLLRLALPLVKPGGRLVYAVCSLIDREGRDQIQQIVRTDPLWQPVHSAGSEQAPGRSWGEGILLTPAHDGTDGFFFAVLEKPC